MWALVLLVLGWVAFGWADWGYDDSEDVAESIERAADVSLAVSGQLGDSSKVVNWVLGMEDRGETRSWVLEDLQRDGLADLTDLDEFLTGEAPEVEEGDEDWLLADVALGGEQLDEGDWRKLKSEYDGCPVYSWEAEALQGIAGSRGPDWIAETVAVRPAMERWMVVGTIVAASANVLAMIAGLLFLPAALATFRSPGKPGMALKAVPWKWVCAAFLISDLAASWAMIRVYSVLGTWDDWPWALDVMIDAAWRIGGAALLVWMIVPRSAHAWRIFGFDRPVGVRASLGTLGVLLLASSVWYPLAGLWFPEAPGLDFSEDGWGGLVFSVLSGVVLAPVCEELVFRGCLFGGMWSRLGFWPAALGSSAVFSAIHHYGVGGTVGVFGIGVAACLLYRHTKSLKGPILVHAAYNLLITLSLWPVYHAPYSVVP